MPNRESFRIASEKLIKDLPHLSADELEYWVRHHNDAYFLHNAPQITDEAFDKLVETLRMVKPDATVLQELGERVELSSESRSLRHREPMLSLEKCYDDETFQKWRDKISGSIVAMPKIDGVACAIHYDSKGELVLGLTRGDGSSGEDITQNIRRIHDIKTQLENILVQAALEPENGVLEIRGEVYMAISRFKEKYENDFANPRNLAAGALKQKDPEKSAAYGLSFFPYDVRGGKFATEAEKFSFLQKCGFKLSPLNFLKEDEKIKPIVQKYLEDRDTLDFEIDGVVARADLVREQVRLGETSHHPKFAIAYKFQGESAQTHLVNVEWSVARTGAITPVAVVKPVFVSGATVTRASLHNLRLFNEHGLRTDSLVEIVRRGGVIPHVERVLRATGEALQAPRKCPSCNEDALIDGDILRCSKPSQCLQIQVARILHYCSVLELEGFGEKWIRVLVEKKLVKSPADLYRLKMDQLLQLDRMGNVLAEKLLKSVQDKRALKLADFLCALGFSEIGPTVARILAQHFNSLESLRNASSQEVTSVYGIGESIGTALSDGFSLFKDEIDDLLSEVTIVQASQDSKVDESHPLFAKSVVFTGKMAHLDRKKAQSEVRKVGGQTPASVSSSTDFVVIGDDGSALLQGGAKSSKHKDAEKLAAAGSAVRIISETEFLKFLRGPVL